jgi:hypothetical protein
MQNRTKLVVFCCLGGLGLIAEGCGGNGTVTDAAPGGGSDGSPGGSGPGSGLRDAASTACVAMEPAGATMAWQDNGAPECALAITATRSSDSTQDFFEIIGATGAGVGLAITVVTYGSPLGGTYTCKSDGGIGSQYVDFVYPGTLLDCTVTIVNPGTPGVANAQGTFSATLTATAGGTSAISQGVFDTPVTGA